MADGTTESPAASAPPGAICKPGMLERFIGQTATGPLGTKMLKLSGARTLRWLPPGMAVTMDYREDRLTVSYDETYTILRARCG